MTPLLLAVLVLAADPPKLPPLDAKEWKAVGDAGLKVWDVTAGSGDPVAAGSTLRFHLTGWTAADGKVFYNSRQNNATETQSLDNLVKGAREGLPGMKPGGVRRLLVPPALGVERPRPGVPANSTLVFEFELFGDPLKLPDLQAKQWKDGPEGLKVWDVAVGSGEAVQPGDTVTCHYTGWTTDGAIFDSSVRRNEVASFSLASVIRGWTIGIPGMKAGGIRRLNIPFGLAYGENGRPPTIPGRADLIFEIEVRKTSR